MKSLTIIMFATLFSALSLHAESVPSITVIGEGDMSVAPDMARVTLGVTARASEAEEALDATSDAVADVLRRLDLAGIAPEDVQTSNLSLAPIRAPRGTDGNATPEITGFEARNTLRVAVRDLDLLGDVLDRVVANGANTLSGLDFMLQDPAPVMALARAAAVKDALARAAQMADAAGVELGDILSISEQGGRAAPMMEMAAARVADVPVAAGTLTLSARVSMQFEIEQ